MPGRACKIAKSELRPEKEVVRFSGYEMVLYGVEPKFCFVVPGGVVVDGEFFAGGYVAHGLYEYFVVVVVHIVLTVGLVRVVVHGYEAQCHAAELLSIGLPLKDIIVQDGLVEVEALVVGHHYYGCSFYNGFGFYGFSGEDASAFAGCVGEVNVWFWHECMLCVMVVYEKRVG